MFYSVLKIILRILFKIFLRLEVKGAENIPATGPLVIASNHLSLLDPPVIGVASTRKVHFMANRSCLYLFWVIFINFWAHFL